MFLCRILCNSKYVFAERGKIEVKGKGRMETYFLLGNNEKLANEELRGDDEGGIETPTRDDCSIGSDEQSNIRDSDEDTQPDKSSMDTHSKLCSLM